MLKRVSSAPNHFQPGKILKMVDTYSKQLWCLQQEMIVLLTTSVQLSTKPVTLGMHRQNTLKNMISISVSKGNRIKKQLF